MRALITGASGFVGLELTKQLLRNGSSVIACVGPDPSPLETWRISELERVSAPTVALDLRKDRPFETIPEDWDTLFHLASYVRTEVASQDVHVNDEGTRRMLGQLSLGGKRVVYTSTLAVADNAPGGRITPDLHCAPRTEYGRTKLAAEGIVARACEEDGAPWTILRLPTLYGPGYRPSGLFDVLSRLLGRQNVLARLDWPGQIALMAVDGAAEMIRRTATSHATRGQSYLASSNENPTVWEIARAIAEANEAPYRPIRVPGVLKRLLDMGAGGLQLPFLPHGLQVTAWRTQLLLDGLYCDGSPLTTLLDLEFQDWRKGVHRMYAEDPRTAGTVPAES